MKRKVDIRGLLGKIFSEKLLIDCIHTIIKAIIFTVIPACFLFITHNLYKEREEIKDTNSKIESLCLGESKDYIDDLLGKPRFELVDNQLYNAFYPLEHAVIRCVFDEENTSLVAYFVTAKKRDSGLVFGRLFYTDEIKKFGENVFDSAISSYVVSDGNRDLEYGLSADAYYWGHVHFNDDRSYNAFVEAILPYGFMEEKSDDLMREAGKEVPDMKTIESYRNMLSPNTFGYMDSNYENAIKPFTEDKENFVIWEECIANLSEN